MLKKAKETGIIIGPKIWCNSGLDIEIYRDLDDPLSFLEENKKRPEITYITVFFGHFSAFCFKKGASVLKYAETIIPTYPAEKSLEQITLTKKGKLSTDEYPHGWSHFDWEVYENMRDVSTSFGKVGGKLGVPWQTVRDHFNKIVDDCKPWIIFLPKGYDNYQQAYLMFKTDYEVGLREELQKLDRTSIIWKFNDTILLHLFLDETLFKLHRHYQNFFNLKKEGIIHDLHVSIPIGWYSLYW